MDPVDSKADVIIALVGGIGVAFDRVITQLRRRLEDEYDFTVREIRVTALFGHLAQYSGRLNAHPTRSFRYYNDAIKIGNEIRQQYGADALARLAIREIHEQRDQSNAGRVAYIVHSLKRPEEIEQFRQVYGTLSYCLAIYADEAVRRERLTKRFITALTAAETTEDAAVHAMRLVSKDSSDELDYGQAVRKAFQNADYFLRTDEGDEMERSIDRFLQLLLDQPYVSPTKGELAMMHAYTAGLRSVDLSRQVGAALVSRDARLITTGCNEVPRAGGGQYWEGDPDDARDFRRGHDENDYMKREAIVQLLGKLGAVIQPEFEHLGAEGLYARLQQDNVFADTRIDALVEFGRIVHAENAAVDGAAFEGLQTSDADLYCTTFPCHMCSRVLIDAGIRNVFYIEPYPKSATHELYPDSIVINPQLSRSEYARRLESERLSGEKLYFIPFEGVAPRRFLDLFRNGRRKTDEGDIERFEPRRAIPRQYPRHASYLAAEKDVSEAIKTAVLA